MSNKNGSVEYTNLEEYLHHNSIKKGDKSQKRTHSRIPSSKPEEDDFYGGSYHISYDDPVFWNLYWSKVNKKNNGAVLVERLTELQNIDDGNAICIDLDLKYDLEHDFKSLKDSPLKKSDECVDVITDIISSYTSKLSILLKPTECKVPVFVFQKNKMSKTNEYFKDGLHIVFGIKLKHDMQQLLRKEVLKTIQDEVFSSLPLINNADDIIDESITTGNTGWQLYKSRKPYNLAYKLQRIYILKNDEDQGIHNWLEYDIADDDVKADIFEGKNPAQVLSIHNTDWKELEPTQYALNQIKSLNLTIKKKKSNSKYKIKGNVFNQDISNMLVGDDLINKIKSNENLDKIINMMLLRLPPENYELKDTYKYTMILDERYYSSYEKWLKVGWALHNNTEHPLYFLIWVKFSSKWDKFKSEQIDELYDRWKDFETSGLTHASIRYWAKEVDISNYYAIKNQSTEKLIQICFTDECTTDIAKLAKHLWYENYRCTIVTKNEWYKFDEHRWKKNDGGVGLRNNLSNKLSELFSSKNSINTETLMKQTQKCIMKKGDDSKHDAAQTGLANSMKLSKACRDSSDKNRIMRDCRDIFHDDKLYENLDENPNLLCCKNGIVDFEEQIFRPGKPDDYCSKSTKINYIKLDRNKKKHKDAIKSFDKFMSELFVDIDLRKYMWEHLASCLIGNNTNQTFNIWSGCGGNGKSVLADLMQMILGDYFTTLRKEYYTQKQVGSGGANSDLASIKGTRMVVSQEPSKGEFIYEGAMKELVAGNDTISAREIYREKVTFKPQCTVIMTCNNLPRFRSNDRGTWRRVRKLDFDSTFIPPDEGTPSTCPADMEFIADKEFGRKLKTIAPYFLSMLVEIAMKTKGNVSYKCEKILSASKKYRQSQDYLSLFFDEKITKGHIDDKIAKSTVKREFISWFKEEYPEQKKPPSSEIVEFLDIKCGKYKKAGWWGWKIKYEDYPDEEYDVE
jgi:P4 family phage/plasmid primase-like protien